MFATPFTFEDYLELLRVKQWVKNGFIFVGILFAKMTQPHILVAAFLSFISFSLIASSIYLLNDVRDREADRLHPIKRKRLLVEREINPLFIYSLFFILLGLGLEIAIHISLTCALLMLTYILLNLSYIYYLKTIVIIDVFIIAAGYLLRILVGTIGIGIPPSQWLILCSILLALFLGFAKRRAEMMLPIKHYHQRSVLNQYSPAMLDILLAISSACAIMSYGLYATLAKPIGQNHDPYLIYTLPLVIYGFARYLYQLYQCHEGEDPTLLLMKDKHILITVFIWILFVILF